MKKVMAIVMIVSLLFVFSGCFKHIHTVGSGGQNVTTVSTKQWYILWGIVPLNQVDSKTMAAGATNYTVTTQQSFIDGVIGIVTGILTIQPQTVTVSK